MPVQVDRALPCCFTWAIILRRTTLMRLFALLLFCVGTASAATLAPTLQPFAPYLERSWRGEFADGSGVDVAHWQAILNGQAIRIVHSVNDGQYGGESLIYVDKASGQIHYLYVTTAGFQTRGVIRFEQGTMVAEEQVSGSSEGITAVRSSSSLSNERLETRSEYLKNGSWVAGHQLSYRPTSDMPRFEPPSQQVKAAK